jgi:hypothetical protein
MLSNKMVWIAIKKTKKKRKRRRRERRIKELNSQMSMMIRVKHPQLPANRTKILKIMIDSNTI